MALPRIAYPHREHGTDVPDDYPRWEAKTRAALPDLDPGILFHVTLMRREGFETIWSCQGGEGHDSSWPWIEFAGGPGEGLRAVALALRVNLPVRALDRRWSIVAGEIMAPRWVIEFHHQHAERIISSRADRPGRASNSRSPGTARSRQRSRP